MRISSTALHSFLLEGALVAGFAVAPALGQSQYPAPSPYPPPNQQYPAQNQQYPPPQQGQYGAPPRIAPAQLDQLVGPIALYPDGLLAQVLTGSTFYQQIPDAAGWANQHSYINGPALASAIQQDQLPWDPSVLALLPFPQVLNYMATNMAWTQELGNAVLAQRGDVMDAVQRERQRAYEYGYLRDNQYQRVVAQANYIEIVPVTPNYYYVPYYNPVVVYSRPRPGFSIGAAIRFGPGITIGAFAPFGWGGVGFGWREHTILVDRRPWGRSWDNRAVYARPYADRREHWNGPREERHELRGPARHDDRDHRDGDRDHRDGDHGHDRR